VDEVGEGVSDWSPGERVLVDPMPMPDGPKGMIGEMYDGGRAEYCLARASALMRIPPEVSFEAASSLPLAYATAHRLMVTRGHISAGETVLVLGASGGVGTACVMLAKLAGARVIACTGSDEKAERLRAIGADEVLRNRGQGLMEAVHALVGRPRRDGSGGVHMAVNYTGGQTWQETLRCLKHGGRLLSCGATAGFDEAIDVRYVWSFELNLMGSDGWRRSDIQTLLDLTRDHRLAPVIDRVMPLDVVQEAEFLLEAGTVVGKIVIAP